MGFEEIKTVFTPDDLNDPDLINPCDYCSAIELWPRCKDGATTSACNHCRFNIVDYCWNNNIRAHEEEII